MPVVGDGGDSRYFLPSNHGRSRRLDGCVEGGHRRDARGRGSFGSNGSGGSRRGLVVSSVWLAGDTPTSEAPDSAMACVSAWARGPQRLRLSGQNHHHSLQIGLAKARCEDEAASPAQVRRCISTMETRGGRCAVSIEYTPYAASTALELTRGGRGPSRPHRSPGGNCIHASTHQWRRSSRSVESRSACPQRIARRFRVGTWTPDRGGRDPSASDEQGPEPG